MSVHWKWLRAVVAAVCVVGVVLPGSAAAAADRSRPPVPVPQPLGECYKRCSSPALLRTATPTLVVLLSGLAGARQRADLEVRSAPRERARLVARGESDEVQVPRVSRWTIPAGVLTDGGTYFWRARAVQGDRRSYWSAWQQFTVDTTEPDAPTVVSPEYPEREWGAVLGTPGTFTFSSQAADVVEFTWSLNSGSVSVTPATGAGPRTAVARLTPDSEGVNTLTVDAVDAAGHRSDGRTYQFNVSPPPIRFAHWQLDETSGTTAADSGNLAAPGTLSGAVAFGPGYLGGANGAVFTGDGRIATAGPVLDGTQSFTVTAWVNPSDLSTDRTVLSQGGVTASRFQLRFLRSANGGAGGWCFTVHTADAADTGLTACADGSRWGLPTVGRWVHLAGTYDAVTGRARIVVGGGEGCFGESAQVDTAGSWPGTGPFVIGESMGAQTWRGGIDDVQAHRKLLSEARICQMAAQ
jgi:hypothetical protein